MEESGALPEKDAMTMTMTIAQRILRFLSRVPIWPQRLHLTTVCATATLPMLRGAWGRALHGLDIRTYKAVFEGAERVPAFLLRPCQAPAVAAFALDWVVLPAGLPHRSNLLRAWDVAS